MIIPQLHKAQVRLRLTQRAFDDLQKAGTDPVKFDEHWIDFLIHWKGTYSKIEQAAKETPQERQWFGAGKNKERKRDSLLRWLYEARNDEEHGLVDSATHRPDMFQIKIEKDMTLTGMGLTADGKPLLITPDGPHTPEVMQFLPAESVLHEVTGYDRKEKVPPPTEHLGSPMEPKPLIAAELGLRWLEALVAEAETIHKPSK